MFSDLSVFFAGLGCMGLVSSVFLSLQDGSSDFCVFVVVGCVFVVVL